MKKTEGFERIFCFGSTLPLTNLLYFITLFSIAGKGKENISPDHIRSQGGVKEHYHCIMKESKKTYHN